MPRPTGLLSLGLGLALGATAAATLRHVLPRAPDAVPAESANTASAEATARISGVPLLLPPRLSAAEADAALAAYLALPPLPDKASTAEIYARLARLRALLTVLPADHFDRLFAALASRVGAAEARLRRAAFLVWAERDAPAAARWALAIVPGEAVNASARRNYLHLAASAWGEADFDAAYAWVGALADSDLAATLAGTLLAQLVRTDPARALTLARARGDAFFAKQRMALFDAWAEDDPAAAARTLGAEFERNDFNQWNVLQTLNRWVARDPASALEWIVARPADEEPGGRTVLESMLHHLARDPRAARATAEFIAARPELAGQFGLLRQLTQSWVQTDPAATLAWLDTLPSVEQRNELLERGLGMVGSKHFLDYARRLPPSPARDQRIGAFVANFVENHPENALAWIEANDSPELAAVLPRVEGALLAHLARTDPAAATARWQSLPTEADRIDAAGPIARAWTSTDPAAAAAWMLPLLANPGLSQEQSQTLNDGYLTAISQLARTDPEAVLRLAETATGDARGNAYLSLANDSSMGVQHDGETPVPHALRADLLASIPDAKARETSLGILLRNWMRRDYESARAWLDTHDAVSPETAARLLDQNDPANPQNF